MENVTPGATPNSNAAVRRKVAELQEHQGWEHHVADAATGTVLTTELRGPVTPLSRAKRLSQLGDQFDPSIFGTPTHRLTPRHPYQFSPMGYLRFFGATEVSSLGDLQPEEGHAMWGIWDLSVGVLARMEAMVIDPPRGRCLLTLHFATYNVPGQVGTIRIEVLGYPGDELKVLASLQLNVHRDNYQSHTTDLVFISVPPPYSPLHWVTLDPGSGLDTTLFASVSVAPARPLDIGV
jgi:hypothetical protein